KAVLAGDLGVSVQDKRRLITMSQALWTQQGETLSHNNACKEFGLEEYEIIEAMKAGKLQYKKNYAHGNPYFKLLRKEVRALTIELRGEKYFEKQEIEYKIRKITKEINSCKRKLKAFEKEKDLLIKKLDHIKNPVKSPVI
ncbi:MAG: hypothetical protein ACMUJM_25345, partial [bacterium]